MPLDKYIIESIDATIYIFRYGTLELNVNVNEIENVLFTCMGKYRFLCVLGYKTTHTFINIVVVCVAKYFETTLVEGTVTYTTHYIRS